MNPITSTIEIDFNGTKFTIDLADAEKLGLLVPVRKPVTDFKIGDVFAIYNKPSFFIVQTAWKKDSYSIMGLFSDAQLGNYSNQQHVTKAELIEYINQRKAALVGNLSKVVENYFQMIGENLR